MWPNPQFPADLVTFTEEIFNGKLNLCSGSAYQFPNSKGEGNKDTSEIVPRWTER